MTVQMTAINAQTQYPEAAGLIPHLTRVAQGSQDDIRTPLFGKADRNTVLSEWLKVLQSSPKVFDELLTYEEDEFSKAGPLSQYGALSSILSDVEEYFEEGKFKLNITHPEEFEQAKVTVAKMIFGETLQRLRPRSKARVLEALRRGGKLSTNSGLDLFMRKSKVVEMNRVMDGINSPAVLGTAGYSYLKTRKFWMIPFGLNVEEMQFQQIITPLLQATVPQSGLVSQDELDIHMTDIMESEGLKMNTDFVHMDQNFKWSMRRHVADIFAMGFQKPHGQELIDLHERTSNIPLIISSEVMLEGSHGEASGLAFTNADESAYQMLMWTYLGLIIKKKIKFQVVGDDGTIWFEGLDPETVITFIHDMGFDAELSKSRVSSKTLIYLRKLYDNDYRDTDNILRAVYPSIRALNSTISQKKFYNPEDWSPDMVVIRTLQILENCNEHPLFVELIEYVKSGDKFGLGTLIDGFKEKLTPLFEEFRKIPGAYDTYVQSRQNVGILDWKIVKYLYDA